VTHKKREKGEGVLEINFNVVCFLCGGNFYHVEKSAIIMFLMKSFLKTLTLLFLGMYFGVVAVKCADAVVIVLLLHG